jgi:hypothetical protein
LPPNTIASIARSLRYEGVQSYLPRRAIYRLRLSTGVTIIGRREGLSLHVRYVASIVNVELALPEHRIISSATPSGVPYSVGLHVHVRRSKRTRVTVISKYVTRCTERRQCIKNQSYMYCISLSRLGHPIPGSVSHIPQIFKSACLAIQRK